MRIVGTDRARADRVAALIGVGRWLDARGYAPATAGNYSARLEDGTVAVTVSGAHKGALGPDDFIIVGPDGRPRDPGRTPSAETPLHCMVYRRLPTAGCVLHTHSVNATVLSRHLAGRDRLVLEGYELLKAFRGIETHETAVGVPIFANTQDMPALARDVDAGLADWASAPQILAPGFLIRGHGLYAWGVDTTEARRHVEAFEFLFACELERARLKA